MALKFRLKGLAETFIDEICCPSCGTSEADDTHFTTEYTKVTFEGIVVVAECKLCGEIFVPDTQRLGVINPCKLREAVLKDSVESGEPLHEDGIAVRLSVEKMNAVKRGELQ